MDHVIEDMKDWIRAFQHDDGEDKAAIECIQKAIKELEKYYTDYDQN